MDEKISHGFLEQKNAAHEARIVEKLHGDTTRLDQLEEIIGRGLSNFLEVGQALAEIRDSKLYQPWATFALYCRKRWNISRFYAHRLIDASEVTVHLNSNLLPIGNTLTNEAQAREFHGLEPDQQKALWEESVNTAPNGLVTAQHIRESRRRLIRTPQEKEKESRQRWKALWHWIRNASTLDPQAAADDCANARLAQGYLIESEKAIVIIRQFQTRLKKRFKLTHCDSSSVNEVK